MSTAFLNNSGVFRRLTPIHVQKYCDANGNRLVIEMGDVCTASKKRAYFRITIGIDMGDVHFALIFKSIRVKG